MCSTPFGINGRDTFESKLNRVGRRVLNAFRHQRKGHRAVGPCSFLWPVVLNAFRHQRKGHGKMPNEPDQMDECSTPFGINGRDTSRSRRS